MASDGVISELLWGHMDIPESTTGSSSQNSVRKWLTTTVTGEDAKHEPPREAAEPLRRNPSSDDDLALGVEASLYGKQGVRTVQEFLRWSRSSPALSRWNSISSAASGHSVSLSLMDILNLWNDDPEEFLLDLGFGCDEPDLSGRIPARFINYQSQARGINLQVFLEAQQSRLDLENPDVSTRFRQLEVLQQVTTAFSSLVGSSSSSTLKAQLDKDLPPEARERRRRMGMLFRRASKKSLSQIHNQKAQDLSTADVTSSPCAAPESLQSPPNLTYKKVPLKRLRPGHLETVGLSPLAEELGAGPDPQSQSHVVSFVAQEGALRPGSLKEGHPLTAMSILQRKKSPCQAKESFEMEEIHSFDDGSVTGSYTGGAETIVRGLIRTNSCQSDSSGFLEEPYVPSLPQQGSPGPDLIKALSGLSGGSTDSHSSERPGSPSPSHPHTSTSPLLSSSLTSSSADKPSSPCPSPEPSSVFGLSPPPALPCLLKSDLESSETPSNQDQSPVSLLQSQTHSQFPPLPSPATFTSTPMQPSSGADEVESKDKDAPWSNLSTLPHDSEDIACSESLNVPPTVSSSSPSPNLDCPFSTIAMSSESFSGSSEKTPSGSTKQALHINPLSASGGLSSLLSSCPHLPSSEHDFHSSSSFVSPPLVGSLSQSSKNRQSDSVFSASHELGLSEIPAETPSFLSLQLDKNKPSAPASSVLDSSKFEEGCPTLPCFSPNLPTSVCQSALSLQSHDPDGLIDLAAGKLTDLTELSLAVNTDPAPTSPVQDVIQVKMDNLSLHLRDTLQSNGKGEGEGERHADTEQTRDAVVYTSDTESSAGFLECSRLAGEEVCDQTETDPQVPSHSLQDELSAKSKQEELRKVCQVEIKGTESESPRRYLVLHDEVAEECSQTTVDSKDLIEIESLDMVFETSVDGSNVENGEADAFFQQLDTEGQVFWAEPIQISNSPHLLEEWSSFDASDGSPEYFILCKDPANSFSSAGKDMFVDEKSLSLSASVGIDQTSRTVTASSDTLSSLPLAPCPCPPPTSDLKPLSRSVSVQMSSSPSSHIVQRRDVPYMTDSKRTLPPSILPLDTSTPFRAVQSWTDLQIQRNKKLSQEILDTVPVEVTLSASAPEKIQRPTQMFSSTPSFPLQSNDWQSHDSLPGLARNYRTVSVSVDTGLWPHKEKDMVRNGNEDETKLWEDNQPTTVVCCCSCDRQCTCCSQKSNNRQQTQENIPYSLDELEEMMLCLQQFCSVLSNMEEQLSEDQAAVYSALSDQDREKVRDIEELRRAVKQEAGKLEKQLHELAHHYDDSLKMKMHRLLDEQSLLCSQLRVFLPGASNANPNRTVATQCCLMPWVVPADMQSRDTSSWSTWNVDSPRKTPPGLESICESLGSSPTKTEKMDIVGFLQRLKESLSHSVNTDSLE